jgi:hypothetical protein
MRELIKEIWSTSKRNKLRTSLTGFAVAWGIFMLIFLLGAGNGLINAQLQQSTRFLANSMRVFPGETSKAYKGLKEGRSITLNDKDILISNKTSSAIRVTHLPTGMVVECQNERSQFQNKDKALEILRSRLLAQKQKQQQDAINASRQGQVGTGDRSEKIRTYNFPQDRCTDHRIGLTVHNLSKIMDGNLDELIDALATREQAEKLQKLNEQG